MKSAPTYRDRLRLEGGVLLGSGLLVSAILLVASAEARRRPWGTVGQLAGVGLVFGVLGALAAGRAMRGARDLAPRETGSGEPTPLWQLPVIVGALTAAAAGALGGWEAGLHAAGGCAVVGLIQCVVIERVVAGRERRNGARYVRLPGSRILRGTRLGRLPA
jgi:hypothetical protein